MRCMVSSASGGVGAAPGRSGFSGAVAAAGRMAWVLALVMVLFATTPAHAAETLFNSVSAYKIEASRLAGEGKLFVEGPVHPYWPESLAVAGAFALSYAFDRDIRRDLAGSHGSALSTLADGGSLVGNPYLHLGVAAALYGAGAAADSPRLLALGTELGETLVVADCSSFLLKEALGRGRPSTGNGNSRYRPFQFSKDYDSFPSMHTVSSFALAHVISAHTDSLPVRILCYAAAGLVGFSRLYQDKHWASDVVLGAAVGELAGNSVTRYHALHRGEVALAPLVLNGAPSLALVGKF